MLNWLRTQRMNIPTIPIPTSVTEACALEVHSTMTRPPNTPVELPTVHAAAIVADLLENDESCRDDSGLDDTEDDDCDSDNESVATDASSDSDDSDNEDEDALPEIPSVSNSQQALGEQALSRTFFELDEMASKFRDLAEFLKHNQGSLPDSTRDSLTKRCQPIVAFMAEVHRLCSDEGPPSTPLMVVAPPAPSASPRPSGTQEKSSQARKRRGDLLGVSPEKAPKRHQSLRSGATSA
ncbi:hypothetical protein C8R44DRAFT_951908 [Mycena epipterygia]|nr:hypothetical protein C8R44DRAFT_951908 [Mycena epipterygia]